MYLKGLMPWLFEISERESECFITLECQDMEDNMDNNTLWELLEEVEPGSADMGAGLAKVTL